MKKISRKPQAQETIPDNKVFIIKLKHVLEYLDAIGICPENAINMIDRELDRIDENIRRKT